MTNQKKKRITCEIPEELHERIQRHIQWGLVAPVMRVLLERAVDAIEKDGHKMAGLIIDGNFTFVERQP